MKTYVSIARATDKELKCIIEDNRGTTCYKNEARVEVTKRKLSANDRDVRFKYI